MPFGQHAVHQQNIFSGTIRPVRRMESTWGEDGDIVYKTKEEQKQTLKAAKVDPEALMERAFPSGAASSAQP